MKAAKKIDRAKMAEDIKNNQRKINDLDSSIAKQKAKKKECEKQLKSDVKDLVNSYPSKKQGKAVAKKLKKSMADLSKVS